MVVQSAFLLLFYLSISNSAEILLEVSFCLPSRKTQFKSFPYRDNHVYFFPVECFSAIKISIVGLVTFVSFPFVNAAFRAMFISTASRHDRRWVNPFAPDMKTIVESVCQGKNSIIFLIYILI